ncbi:MAG TPA: oligosaccharide flippase family protein [Gaiellaceae bacterium]|jgi:O-antigen/teichoic acid export membrane protein|nr:oligosaccharide flippase family protein [Gaiellaceae bacterium]
MDEPSIVPATQPARLRTDVFLTMGGKAASLLVGLLMVVLIARELGPSRQGLFAVAFSLTLMLIHLGGLGLTTANPYFTAREPDWRPRIVANAVWLAGGLGLALVAVGVGVKLVAPGSLEGLGWAPLAVAFAGAPGALAALFLQSVLLGEGRIVAYNGIEVAQFSLTLLALAAGFWLLDFQITGTLAVITASRFGSALAYLAFLRQPLRWLDLALARRMLAYSFRAYLAIVASFLVIRLDLLLVNGYLGSRQTGLYSIAATVADGMFVLPMVVGLNLFPRVARSGESQETAEVFRSVAVLYGLVCLATVPLAGPAIRLVFGDDFDGSVSLYYWLLPGIYCLGLLTILAHHFAGRGYPIQAAAVWFVGLGLNLAINVAFLPGRGPWVAALASSIAYAVLLGLHIRLFVREAGGYGAVRPRPFEVVRFVRTALR